MLILADENIPFAREAFSRIGELESFHGRSLTAEQTKNADALLVRSVTKVNADLLEECKIKFVGTATIGTDHVDEEYLAERGIAFASAPGSNANSVAEYMTAALLELEAEVLDTPLNELTLGIIGVGNVGSRVEKKARALGMKTLLNDPPLARQTGDPKYLPLDKIFAADIITTHVPLTKEGPDATVGMINEEFISRMRDGAIYFNTSRGGVVDECALHPALDSGKLRAAVLDVWANEPNIDPALLKKTFIGTPHIAGYSFDGKVNGTQMLFDAVCAHFGIEASWDPADLMPPPEHPLIDADSFRGGSALREVVRTAYSIRKDDAALRKMLDMPREKQGAHFDRLRKEYPIRREFRATTVRGGDESIAATSANLGFKVKRK